MAKKQDYTKLSVEELCALLEERDTTIKSLTDAGVATVDEAKATIAKLKADLDAANAANAADKKIAGEQLQVIAELSEQLESKETQIKTGKKVVKINGENHEVNYPFLNHNGVVLTIDDLVKDKKLQKELTAEAGYNWTTKIEEDKKNA